jgi:hydroxymethylglutaryl-CoA synthase
VCCEIFQVTPKEFVETMQLMETRYGAKDFIPVSSKSTLRPSTFFITQVDALYRRGYDRYPAKAEANGANGTAH